MGQVPPALVLAMEHFHDAALAPRGVSIPEIALWRAVLLQAVSDAFGNFIAGEQQNHRFQKEKAVRFLTTSNPNLGRVCALAALDPDWVREKIIERYIENAPPIENIKLKGRPRTQNGRPRSIQYHRGKGASA